MTEFSVVVHTYNRSQLLRETLAAIARQDQAPAEVIVVDDGSIDDTEFLVRSEFSGFHYTRIANSGCGAARMYGADLATKEWILFCDDDDIWLPNHISSRSRLIARFPQVGFTFSNFGSFGPDADKNYAHFNCAPRNWWKVATEVQDGNLILLDRHAFRNFLAFNPAYPLTWGVRKDVYRQVGGIDARYSRWQAEDTHFSRRCILQARVACDETLTAMYRRHGSNMSAVKQGNYLSRAAILEDIIRSGLVPDVYTQDAERFILNSKRTAFMISW